MDIARQHVLARGPVLESSAPHNDFTKLAPWLCTRTCSSVPGTTEPPGHRDTGHCSGQGFPEVQAPRCPALSLTWCPTVSVPPSLAGCSPPFYFCLFPPSLLWRRFNLVTHQDGRHNRHHLQNPVRPRPRDPFSSAKGRRRWPS